jgi:hypothetical protein
LLKSGTVWESAPSVPQPVALGVQLPLVAGLAPAFEQLLSATMLPLMSWQVTARVSVPEFAVGVQVPVRVSFKLVVQAEPTAGVQEVYTQAALPPVQAPKAPLTQL